MSISNPLGEPLRDSLKELLEVGYMDVRILVMAGRVNVVDSPRVSLKEPRAACDLGFIVHGRAKLQHGVLLVSTTVP